MIAVVTNILTAAAFFRLRFPFGSTTLIRDGVSHPLEHPFGACKATPHVASLHTGYWAVISPVDFTPPDRAR